MADLRIADLGQRQRDHCRRHQDGRDLEQDVAVGIGEIERQGRQAAGAPGHHHVDREDAAAIVFRRLVIEPGLDDHERAGDGVAGHHLEQRPGIDVVGHGQQQSGDRGRDREHAERADMADAVDQPLAGQRAGEETGEVCGEHDPDQERGHVARGHLDAHDGADDAERGLDQDDAQQHRNDRLHSLQHDMSPKAAVIRPAALARASAIHSR